jgi:predicted alpha/beta hydrolase family esterase
MALPTSEFRSRRPLILTVPGLGGSGPGHWQTIWEQQRDDCARADLGQWSAPRRNAWVSKLDQAIRRSDMPVILAAHSLGCIAVAWWAELAGQPWVGRWRARFSSLPPTWSAPTGFRRSPISLPPRARRCPSPRSWSRARTIRTPRPSAPLTWLATGAAIFVDAGATGHINADSGLGAWREGQMLLERLIGAAEGPIASGCVMADVQPILAGGSVALPIR